MTLGFPPVDGNGRCVGSVVERIGSEVIDDA